MGWYRIGIFRHSMMPIRHDNTRYIRCAIQVKSLDGNKSPWFAYDDPMIVEYAVSE